MPILGSVQSVTVHLEQRGRGHLSRTEEPQKPEDVANDIAALDAQSMCLGGGGRGTQGEDEVGCGCIPQQPSEDKDTGGKAQED